jgi:hypothetical protein
MTTKPIQVPKANTLPQLNHHLIRRHARAGGHVHFRDHAVAFGADDVLHFHGLEHGHAR